MNGWLDRFNQATREEAEHELLACCASPGWARSVARLRPYATPYELYRQTERAWREQPESEWDQAFAAHPRIGEAAAARPQHGPGDQWSAEEQNGVVHAADQTRERLAEINIAYEHKFGRTYIVCATGRTAEEMLRIAQDRMNNDPATELLTAAAEQEKITRIRLERLLTGPAEQQK